MFQLTERERLESFETFKTKYEFCPSQFNLVPGITVRKLTNWDWELAVGFVPIFSIIGFLYSTCVFTLKPSSTILYFVVGRQNMKV